MVLGPFAQTVVSREFLLSFSKNIFTYVCVYMCAHAWMSENDSRESVLSILRVPGTKLKRLGLGAGALTHWAYVVDLYFLSMLTIVKFPGQMLAGPGSDQANSGSS